MTTHDRNRNRDRDRDRDHDHDHDHPAEVCRVSNSREKLVTPALPPPEEVFVNWLLSVPDGDELEASARRQIALIDKHASRHPDVRYLRRLLTVVAGDVDVCRPLFTHLRATM